MTAFLRTRFLWCLLCTCQALCLSPSRAQSVSATATAGKPITGKVTTTTGEALPGVTILQKGTNRGTTTGIDGTFSLTLPDPNATLTVSYVGYVAQERAVEGASTIDVALAGDTKELDEVVEIGRAHV